MNDSEFRIWRVLRQAGGIAFWPNLARWLALMALVQSPRIVLDVSGLENWLYSHWALASLWSVVASAIWLVGQATVIDGMFMHLSGRRVGLADLVRVLLRSRASLIQLAIAYGIALELLSLVHDASGDYALTLLIDSAVGIVGFLYLGVTVPVVVIEQTSAFEALKRSVFLTGSHGARMFGLYLLFRVAASVSRMALTPWISGDSTFGPGYIVAWVVFSLIMAVFWAAIITALYRALRLAREGIDIQNTLGVPNARIHTAV